MELEVTKKVRMAIKAKLLELGVHVDEELPDYIMILIANRRTKVQMEEDLSLFLGDNTIKFSNWLHQVLRKLEEVTAAPPLSSSSSATTKPSSEGISKPDASIPSTSSAGSKSASSSTPSLPSSTVVRKSSSSEATTLNETPSLEEEEEQSSTKGKSEIDQTDSAVASKRKSVKDSTASGIKSPVAKKSKSTLESTLENETAEPLVKKSGRPKSPISFNSGSNKNSDTGIKIASKISTITPESPSSATAKTKSIKDRLDIKSSISAPKSVITPITFKSSSSSSNYDRSRSPIRHHRRDRSSSPHSSDSRNTSNNKRRSFISMRSDRSRSPQETTTLKSSIGYKSSGNNTRSRSRSPLARARKSLKSLVAVVKRHNEINNASKDEEYNPSRPAVTSTKAKVASEIHVTERPKRATKQQERGSNNLLVRALADAQKSIVIHSTQSKTSTDSSKEKDKDKEAKQGVSGGDDDGGEDNVAPQEVDDDDQQASVSRKSHFSKQIEHKQQRSEYNRKKKDGSKLSIKERLGYRIDNNKQKSSRSLERKSDIQRQFSDLELETHDFNEEFTQGEGDFKMIVVNVPTSTTTKERNVTLEKLGKQLTTEIQPEEPKRLSIQLNVDSDSDSDEDELELQPGPTEDADFDEPTPIEPPQTANTEEDNEESTEKTNENKDTAVVDTNEDSSKSQSRGSSESGVETATTKSKRSKKESEPIVLSKESKKSAKRKEEKKVKKESSTKVKPDISPASDDAKNGKQQEDQGDQEGNNEEEEEEKEREAENSDEQEEVIIEEEEIEDDDEELEEVEEYEVEDDEDGDYDVVLQENVRLPDPDDVYGKQQQLAFLQKKIKKVRKGNHSIDEGEGASGQDVENPMETKEYVIDSPPGQSNYEMDTEGLNYEYVNPNSYSSVKFLSSRLNHDTKFVVTMDGNQSNESSMMYDDEQEEEEYMETETYSPDTMDLRHRISRTVLQKPSALSTMSNYALHQQSSVSSTPLTSSHYNASSRAYLPITGAPPPLRPTTALSSSSGGPACKYWPDCTFKEKCIYPHPKCKYGAGCNKLNCPYKHDNAAFSTSGTDDLSKKPVDDGKIQCKFFPKCHSMSCQFYHPTPCRFGIGCTNIKCKSYHPGQTVGQQRSQMLPFASSRGHRHSSTTIPAASALRWKAPKTTTDSPASSSVSATTTTPTASVSTA